MEAATNELELTISKQSTAFQGSVHSALQVLFSTRKVDLTKGVPEHWVILRPWSTLPHHIYLGCLRPFRCQGKC